MSAQLEDPAAYDAGGNAIALNRELISVPTGSPPPTPSSGEVTF